MIRFPIQLKSYFFSGTDLNCVSGSVIFVFMQIKIQKHRNKYGAG